MVLAVGCLRKYSGARMFCCTVRTFLASEKLKLSELALSYGFHVAGLVGAMNGEGVSSAVGEHPSAVVQGRFLLVQATFWKLLPSPGK